MVKINYIVVLLLILSCNTKKTYCNDEINKFNKILFNRMIDTNALYILEYIADSNKGPSNKFIESENDLIKKIRPCIKFHDNGNFIFHQEYLSYKNKQKPTFGKYKFYNDTIETCREYYSVQSGKYYGKSIITLKDSLLVESNINNSIIKIYSKHNLAKSSN